MFSKSSRLKKIGIGLGIWGFAKAIWDAIGHIGNGQTLWDMISAAAQYWPSILRGAVWVVTSWWFPLIASTICLSLWWFLSRKQGSSFGAVTFEDAVIFSSEDHDGTELLRDIGKPTSAHFSGITVSHDKDSMDCMLPVTFRWENQSETKGIIARLRVDSETEAVCKAVLTSLKSNYRTLVSGVQLPLLFTPAQSFGSDTKAVKHGQSEYLELLWIPNSGEAEIMTNFPFAFTEYKKLNRIVSCSLQVAFSVNNIITTLVIDAAYSSGVWMVSIRPPSVPSEQLTRGESRQLKGRRDKLKNLLAKKERLAAAKSSPGFDMDAARRRNEKFIAEVRADIERLEGEQSKPVTIVTESGPKGFQIEALPPIPDVLNLTQHTWHEGAKIMFTGDAVLGVTNRLLAQGIDLVSFRLLSISPPMKAVKAHKPSTLDAALKRIDFSEDIPATLVAGKTNDVRLFKATRPFSANSLKDISIEFYGKWPEGYYSVFTPSERHELTVEVTGKGVSREEATFQLRFSYKETEPVFSIKTIRAAVGRA